MFLIRVPHACGDEPHLAQKLACFAPVFPTRAMSTDHVPGRPCFGKAALRQNSDGPGREQHQRPVHESQPAPSGHSDHRRGHAEPPESGDQTVE